jgi:hypothetical protein
MLFIYLFSCVTVQKRSDRAVTSDLKRFEGGHPTCRSPRKFPFDGYPVVSYYVGWREHQKRHSKFGGRAPGREEAHPSLEEASRTSSEGVDELTSDLDDFTESPDELELKHKSPPDLVELRLKGQLDLLKAELSTKPSWHVEYSGWGITATEKGRRPWAEPTEKSEPALGRLPVELRSSSSKLVENLDELESGNPVSKNEVLPISVTGSLASGTIQSSERSERGGRKGVQPCFVHSDSDQAKGLGVTQTDSLIDVIVTVGRRRGVGESSLPSECDQVCNAWASETAFSHDCERCECADDGQHELGGAGESKATQGLYLTNRASSAFGKQIVDDAQSVTTSEQDRVSDVHRDSVTTREHDLLSDFHCDPDIVAMVADGDFHRHRIFGDKPETEPDSQESTRIPLGKGHELMNLHMTRSGDGAHPRIARETGCVYTPGRAATVGTDLEMIVQGLGDECPVIKFDWETPD